MKTGAIIGFALFLFSGVSWAQTSSTTPSTSALAAVTQTASDTNITLPGVHALTGITATANAPSGGFVMAFDSATVPADGTLAAGAAKGCWAFPATVSPNTATSLGMANAPNIPSTALGLSVVFSTGADCYHLTKAPAWLLVLYQ